MTLQVDAESEVNEAPTCRGLRYTQENVPQRLSDIHRELIEKVNENNQRGFFLKL